MGTELSLARIKVKIMKVIDISLPWYWICEGDGTTTSFFNCKEATRVWLSAKITVWWRNLSSDSVWFVRKDFEHPDPNYKQFKCPNCGILQSKQELDSTWDWAGPHCRHCGNTGMDMFCAVQNHAPVMNGKGAFISKLRSIIGER